MASPTGYSGPQILLHWVIGLMIIFQLIFGEAMGMAWRSVETGAVPVMGAMVWAHILVGGAVLALVAWRLALRLTRGVPPPPATGARPLRLAAHVAHWALYALMVLFPVTGLLAWFGGLAQLAEVHQAMKPVAVLLILLHLVAALWHQLMVKDNLLSRMKTPQA